MMDANGDKQRSADQEEAAQREGRAANRDWLDDTLTQMRQDLKSHHRDCGEYQPLMMGLMDQELTPEEAGRVNDHLTRCQACREEYEQLRDTAGKLSAISFREPTDEVLEEFWKHPYNALERNAGIYLVLGGLAALLCYGGYLSVTSLSWQSLLSGGEDVILKLGVAALLIGSLLLLVSVIRERVRTSRNDPYKDIKR